MKFLKIYFIVFLVTTSNFLPAQVNPGSNCASAGCSSSGSYQNLTGVSSMGQYSCLYSTPNPNWLAIGIQNSGSINLQLQQTSSTGSLIDVDFALYGPYTSVSAGCPIGPSTPTVDCSYSGSATEYVNIANAIAGQVYILLVTNYNGSSGTINLTPQSSTGSINCAINFSATTSQTPATCNQATGSVTVTPTGGYAPYTYSWNIPGNHTTATVNNVAPGTYTCTISSSPSPSGQTVNPTTATVTVQNQNATYSSTSTPASCAGGMNGTATANFNAGSASGVTANYSWNDPNGQTTQTAIGLLPGSYTCTVTLSNGCSGATSVTVGANSVSYSTSSTQVSCPGGSDGTAIANMNPVVGNLSYQWNDPAAQTTQTASNLSAGTYNVVVTSDIGCTGNASVTVTEIPGMTSVITSQTDVTCNSGNNGTANISVSNGTTPYTYSWTGSGSNTNSVTDFYAGTFTATITDANGCVIMQDVTIIEPDPLVISQIINDTMICPEDNVDLYAAGIGGSSPYTFTWTSNGNNQGIDDTINVQPSISPTVYTVTLTEACGSPSTQANVTVSHPTPIAPLLTLPTYRECNPYRFEFFNTSTNSSEIATTYLDFGNGSDVILIGDDSTSMVYNVVDMYSVGMTVTSIYGCVYDTVFVNLLETLAPPMADFNVSANPTTIFETELKFQETSSDNVTIFYWVANGASPGTSNLENPTFNFPEGIVEQYPVTLYVTTPEGCTDSVTKIIEVASDVIFYAPNAFTPDGDEFNQNWNFYVDGIDQFNFLLQIYNRWGEVVWETKDPSIGWDGTFRGQVVPPDAYSWRAEVKDLYNDSKYKFNGTITVLR